MKVELNSYVPLAVFFSTNKELLFSVIQFFLYIFSFGKEQIRVHIGILHKEKNKINQGSSARQRDKFYFILENIYQIIVV